MHLHLKMRSSLPFFSPSLLPKNPPLPFHPLPARISKQTRSTSLKTNLVPSHVPSDNHLFNGWDDFPDPDTTQHTAPRFAVGTTTAAVLVAALACFSLSKKGFKFRLDAPLHGIHKLLMPSGTTEVPVDVIEPNAVEVNQSSRSKADDKPDMAYDVLKPKEGHMPALREKKLFIIPAAADATQQEALSILKTLKIIENDVSANELCTRREYARWLVRANSMLERNPKHRVDPMVLTASSIVTAFDDVSANDPDFFCIQALAEAGIVPSKLSAMGSSISDMNSSDGQRGIIFFPESFISRFDLINWKAMLEYSVTSEMKEKMLRTKVGLLDLSASTSESSPQMFVDLMAGDKSIIRRVFGNIRRLQPQNPVTKAQAAVALTSGRMANAIRSELSRLEVENQTWLAEVEEIRSELIRRGEIQKFWEGKLNDEKERGLEVVKDYQVALLDLEREKLDQNDRISIYIKEKATLDCQQQLLFSLRKEVEGMCDRLANEKANFLAEQQSLEKLFTDLREQQDAITEAKSILEAEKEALQMLRYWVEEEAQSIQGRAKILEKATQRWRWNSNSSEES